MRRKNQCPIRTNYKRERRKSDSCYEQNVGAEKALGSNLE